MTSNNSYSLHKRRYAQISIKKRRALVQLVLLEGKSLSEAGRKLHINPSTVRLIVKKYKQTGVYFNKRLRNTPKEIVRPNVDQQSQENLVKLQENEAILKNQQQKPNQAQIEPRIKAEDGNGCRSRFQYPFMGYGYIF